MKEIVLGVAMMNEILPGVVVLIAKTNLWA